MAKFLNLDGLIYFWEKIKSYVDAGLNGKANSDHIQAVDKGGTGATTAAQARVSLGVSYGTTTGTVCRGDDPRLSDARTPLAHTHPISAINNFPTTMTPTAHNQSASTITAGTFAGQVVAPAGTEYTTARMRNVAFTTTDPGANSTSTLPNGSVLIVYE